jgi:co-chaperonin GroES (HSP10)
MKSKHLAKLQEISARGLLALNGNRLLIELLDEGERTTRSGIVTALAKEPKALVADRARVAVVLAVGPGFEVEETKELVELPYKPGDHVLVNQFGVKTFGEFFSLADYKADSIGLVTDDLIQGKVGNLEEFQALLKG